ncbi:TetR/AcrR family transcriptional regulator [Spongiactinospora sp. TRM90649]|uniref:TetR/AcrR family transcriptional regulator n=1 Tax=Spongiactinospora sp. TRM90649 TaxID=3031114 RepID=UPI0023F843C5|nr:TetR/AcrR family transcriptional regulator [Spongiactinospora sp. TRM90649]MDF5751652.1 TetR/AcrR family transcriptional regulator [Spongiactinospora sp. TRM90649]
MPRATIPDRANVILAHARDVILEKGFRHATIAEIAQRCGVGKGAIYLDFASKEALLDALLTRSVRSLAQAVRDRVAAEDGPVPLSAVYRFALTALLGDRLMLAVYLSDDGVLGEHLRDKGAERYGPRMDWLAHYVDDLRAAGLLRADLDPGAASLMMSVFAVGLANASATLGALTPGHLDQAIGLMAGLIEAGWETGAERGGPAARHAHARLLDRLGGQVDAL